MINRTLIVNDDNILLLVASKMVKMEFSQETVTASNGEAALAYFEKATLSDNAKDIAPEFIFLDIHMPTMNGWDFLEIFSEKYAPLFPDVKVAILSASIDPEDVQQLSKYNVIVDHISGPISIERLRMVKEKCVEV